MKQKNVTVLLPWPSSKLSPNTCKHWSIHAKAKKDYKSTCFFHVKHQKTLINKDVKNLELLIIFSPPNNRKFDLDNLIARMKSGIDGVCLALNIDDSKIKKINAKISQKIINGQVLFEFNEYKE